MSRKSNRARMQDNKAAKQAKAAQFHGVVNEMAMKDAFQNVLARTGAFTPNMMEGTNYFVQRLTQNYQLMTALYRNNWIARRVVDIIPKDMIKNWVRFSCEMTPEQLDQYQRVEKATRVQKAILKGLNWGRLYGGAAGLMLLDGQEDILEEPLDLESVMPGDFKGILITDRWNGIYPALELVEDINSPEFGLPEFYEFKDYTGTIKQRVHHSRILRFTGCDLPDQERYAENHWGSSILEACYEELKKRDNTSANIAALIFQAQLKILQMEDLGETLGSGMGVAQDRLRDTLTAQNWLMSNQGMMVLSREDDFKAINYTFSGINDIYESFMLDMAGAAQIPVTRLFGRSPAGMNSTGESDMRNYYDVVRNEQDAILAPVLDKLLPVMVMSTFGNIPNDFDYVFNPIHNPTDEEIGNNIKWKAEAVFGAHDRGLITDQIGMKELKQFADESGLFTNIQDEDIAKASNEVVKPELAMPGLDEEDPEDPGKDPPPKGDR